MFKDNPLLQQLKQHIKETQPTAEGIVKATEKGFGFLQCDNDKSYFIAPPHMKRLMHGDRIKGIIIGDNDKQSIEPDALLEPGLKRFVGRVKRQRDGRPGVIPDHPLMNNMVNARAVSGLGVQVDDGDWVVAQMLRHPLTDNGFFCEITEFVAKHDDQFAIWKATTARHNLPWDAPTDVAPYEINDPNIVRRDATDIEFFTIDAPSTQDMDDAIAINPQDNGWRVTVAIADPSAYINTQHPLEQEARLRAFTLYLPARTVPMLPTELADDRCSLKPDQRRPALCCEFVIDETGLLKTDATFYCAWITSKHRLSYDQVSDLFETNTDWQPPASLAVQLQQLKLASEARHQWRSQHGVVFSDRPDYRFDITPEGGVEAIRREPRRIAHRMVEEAMISANICAAHKLEQHFGFGVFSTHLGFDPVKLPQVLEALHKAGIEFDAAHAATFEGFCELKRLLNSLEDNYLDLRLRKFYNYSGFSNQGAPHFGLGVQRYATWTSPIRKYGDLLNHRLLKAMLGNQSAESVLDDALSEHLGLKRRSHKIAERNMADYLYGQHYQKLLGDAPNEQAEIFDVSRAGLRVRIDTTGAAAFIPASQLHPVKEQRICDAENGVVMLEGKPAYRLGDVVTVRITEVKPGNYALVAQLVTQSE
jgi:exoribonuclease-2